MDKLSSKKNKNKNAFILLMKMEKKKMYNQPDDEEGYWPPESSHDVAGK